MVADKGDAEALAERFRREPEKVYAQVIETLREKVRKWRPPRGPGRPLSAERAF